MGNYVLIIKNGEISKGPQVGSKEFRECEEEY